MIEKRRSIERLEAEIKAAHNGILIRMKTTLEAARKTGELLVEARTRFDEHKQWEEWVTGKLDMTMGSVNGYMRVARHWDIVEAAGAATKVEALCAIRSAGVVRNIRKGDEGLEELVSEARRLKTEGLSYAEIGRRLGRSGASVNNWLNPDRYARRQAAKDMARKKTKRAS